MAAQMTVMIACVKQGQKYGSEYVLKLQRGIARHMPHKDWEFVCFTDDAVPGVLCQGLTEGLPGWFSKLELFKAAEPLIYFDLDVVITGSLAPLLEWDGFGIIKDAWLPTFNSSVMKLTGNERHVWDNFSAAEMGRLTMGDQQWITEQMPDAKTFPVEWIPSYKAHRCFEAVPDGAIAVNFHGQPKPAQITHGWVKDTWGAPLNTMTREEHNSEIAANKRADAVLSRLPQGKIYGAEIGVATGQLAKRLLARSDLYLVMVDAWEGNGGSYSNGKTDWRAWLDETEQNACCSAALEATKFAGERRFVMKGRSLDVARDIEDCSLDFVFIDADHSYAAVKADLAAWAPKVKLGGLLCGHDYDHPDLPDVKRAVDEFLGAAVQTGEDHTWFSEL